MFFYMNCEKVDVLIAGAAKSATTSLLRYLSMHSAMVGHSLPEFTFFSNDHEYSKGFEFALEKYYADRADSMYKNMLAKHAMLMYSRGGIERALSHNPELKVILLLREPVARLYSGYVDTLKRGLRGASFEDTYSQPLSSRPYEEGYMFDHLEFGNSVPSLNLGEYAPYVEHVMNVCPDNSVKVVIYEELKRDPEKVVAELFSWLGLEPEPVVVQKVFNKGTVPKSVGFAKLIGKSSLFFHRNSFANKFIKIFLSAERAHRIKRFLYKFNSSESGKPYMSRDFERRLISHYAPYNDRLELVLGRSLTEWKRK